MRQSRQPNIAVSKPAQCGLWCRHLLDGIARRRLPGPRPDRRCPAAAWPPCWGAPRSHTAACSRVSACRQGESEPDRGLQKLVSSGRAPPRGSLPHRCALELREERCGVGRRWSGLRRCLDAPPGCGCPSSVVVRHGMRVKDAEPSLPACLAGHVLLEAEACRPGPRAHTRLQQRCGCRCGRTRSPGPGCSDSTRPRRPCQSGR